MENSNSKKINSIITLQSFLVILDVVYFYLLLLGYGSKYRFISHISWNNTVIGVWILVSIFLVVAGRRTNNKLKRQTGKRNNIISITSLIISIPVILSLIAMIYIGLTFDYTI